MPILDNARHERFARALAQGMTQEDAYEEAGYKRSVHHASRLARHGKVQARVAELQERAAAKVEVTLGWLIEQAVGIAKDARQAGSYAAAVSAIKEAGVLTGLRVERQSREHEGHIAVISDEPMSAEEWAAKHAG